MTTGSFQYLDLNSLASDGSKPWAKVDGPGWSFRLTPFNKPVNNLRTNPDFPSKFTTDSSGFSVHTSPSQLQASDFDNDATVRGPYYDEVSQLLRDNLPDGKKISHIEIFDHTIRRHNPSAPRQPVQQVHVDQTPRAAAARVRRHLSESQAEKFLQGRYQIINVWRPIRHAASDFPLAVIDWRSASAEDFVKVDLMYPKRPAKETAAAAAAAAASNTSSDASNPSSSDDDNDDRGKEALPDPSSMSSIVGYEPRGETLTVSYNDSHKFYYVKDMKPEEAMFIKCFDSRSEWINDEGYVSGGNDAKEEAEKFGGFGKGRNGVAMGTPHTAFVDPDTPEGVAGRESIEVRCLVFYDD